MPIRKFIPVAEPSIGELEVEYVNKAVSSGWVSSLGKFVDQFEEEFAKFIGVKHCVALANGTVSLHLALITLGIGPGDEVIVPSLTFVATANAVMYCGATPVFVDSSSETWCLDPACIKKAVTPKTKAIIPVHIYGIPANMSEIMKIAKEHKLYVIEDCAEAHGAKFNYQSVGSFGEIGVFSFYGNKIITTGEGGALVTNDDRIAERARFLKDHGMSKKQRYYHSELGYNYRMTNIQAALGCAQLKRYHYLIEEKNKYLEQYRNELSVVSKLNLNPVPSSRSTVNWLICLDCRNAPRDFMQGLIKHLALQGIDTRPFFIPMHELPLFKENKFIKISKEDIASKLSKSCLNLPSGYNLDSREITYITKKIQEYYEQI